MEKIKSLKILEQRERGLIKTLDPKPANPTVNDFLTYHNNYNQQRTGIAIDSSVNSIISYNNRSLEVIFSPITKPNTTVNGYWIIIQNWTDCSLRCGGGKSYLQRLCIPPKFGGNPCIGETLISRSCNNLPCPDILDLNENNRTEVLKPTIKVMQFTNRPQRYSVIN